MTKTIEKVVLAYKKESNPNKKVKILAICHLLENEKTITKKASNRRINWMFVQAANVASIYDDRLKGFYERCKKRHEGKHVIAITHVANNMIRIIWAMLTLKEPYKSHDAQRYGRKMKRMDKIRRSMCGTR